MWLSEGSTIIVEPSDIVLSSTPLKDCWRQEFPEVRCILLWIYFCFINVFLFAVYFCRTTVPLLLGVAQALGVSSAYVSDPSLINKSLFSHRTGQATPKEPQLPRALRSASPRQFLSFPQGNKDCSYHLSNTQISGVISKVNYSFNNELFTSVVAWRIKWKVKKWAVLTNRI